METLERNEIDIVASRIIDSLVVKGVLSKNSYDPKLFNELHELLKENFNIPQTSITNIMARTLFGISSSYEPLTIVGAGTYTGNALAWLAGKQLINSDKLVKVYGLDTSKDATEIAKSNFSNIKANNVFLLQEDAIEWLNNTNLKIDLLYIDIDTIKDGKRKYLDLLIAAYPKINPGGLVIAHDVNEEKFIRDLKPFLEEIQNTEKFKHSINLNIDSFGISISVKGDN